MGNPGKKSLLRNNTLEIWKKKRFLFRFKRQFFRMLKIPSPATYPEMIPSWQSICHLRYIANVSILHRDKYCLDLLAYVAKRQPDQYTSNLVWFCICQRQLSCRLAGFQLIISRFERLYDIFHEVNNFFKFQKDNVWITLLEWRRLYINIMKETGWFLSLLGICVIWLFL